MTLPVPEAVFPVSKSHQNRYLAYPHSNGFADGLDSLVLGQIDGKEVSLWKISLKDGSDETEDIRICGFDRSLEPEGLLWFDVATGANRLAVVAANALWICDLHPPYTFVCVYKPPSDTRLQAISSISYDGRYVLLGLNSSGQYTGGKIEVATGRCEVLFEFPWFANHFHFCPHDESWVGFCHEGRAELVNDRIWAWHAQEAPQGRCVFDQSDSGLCLGHERWAFHDVSVVAVAYGISPGKPRGVYQFFMDGRRRLISEGDRDWHVNLNHDGTLAVVDTTGPHDAPGRGWDEAWTSDIFLVEMGTGRRHWLARSRINSEGHPSHPHPVFSADGRWIYYNQAEASGIKNRVMRTKNPLASIPANKSGG